MLEKLALRSLSILAFKVLKLKGYEECWIVNNFYNNLDQPKLISWALEFWDKIMWQNSVDLQI